MTLYLLYLKSTRTWLFKPSLGGFHSSMTSEIMILFVNPVKLVKMTCVRYGKTLEKSKVLRVKIDSLLFKRVERTSLHDP